MPQLEDVPGDDSRLAPLLQAYWDEMADRYEEEDGEVPMKPLHHLTRWILLTDDDGSPAGCGAVQPLEGTEPGAPREIGEVKRVYVVPWARGRGYSRTIMARLVDIAREEGFTSLWLDTGTPQHEAVALYERMGWRPIPSYGQFADDPRTLCYALDL